MADKTDNIKTRLSFDGEKEYKDNCAQINSSLKELSSELKLSSAQFSDNGKSVDALRSKQDILKKTFDEQKNKVAETEKALNAMKDAQGENSAGAQRLETALNKAKAEMALTGNQLKQLDTDLIKAKASSDGLGSKLRDGLAASGDKANAALKGVGIAVAGVSAALGKMLGSAVENADGLQKMSDVTGLSAEQLQIMKYQGSALGVELDTMTGAQAKLTKTMDAARSTQVKWRAGIEDQVKAGKISKAQSEEMIETGAGLETSYSKLGVRIMDVDGSLRSSNDVFNEAISKLGGVQNSTERDALAMQIFGKSAMQLNPLIKAGGTELKNMSDEAKKNGAIMSNEAVAGLDSFGDSVDAAKLSIQGAIGTAFSKLTPQLDDLSKKLTSMDFSGISNGMSFVIDHAAPITAGIVGITGAIVAWKVATLIATAAQEIHNAILIIGVASTGGAAAAQIALGAATGGKTLATVAASAAMAGHTIATIASSVATGAATAAQWLFNAALNANPIGIIVVAIVGLVAALVILFNKNKGFHDWVVGAFNTIKNVALSIGNWFSTDFVNFFVNAWNSIKLFFAGIPAWFENIWRTVKSGVSNLWNGITSVVTTGWNNIIGTLSNIGNSIANFFTPYINNFKNNMLAIWEPIKNGLTTAWNGIKEAAQGAWELIKNVVMAPVLILIDLVTGNFGQMKTDMDKIWSNIQNAISTVWNGILTFYRGIWDAISGGFTAFGTLIINGLVAVWNSITTTVKTAWTAITTFFATTWTNISTGLTAFWNGIPTFFTNLWDGIKTIFTNAWNGYMNLIYTVDNTIKTGIINIWNSVITWFTALPGTLMKIGSDMFTSMQTGVNSTINNVVDAVKTGIGAAIDWIKAIPGESVQWGKDIIMGIVDGINAAAHAVEDAVKGVAQNIRSFLHFSVPDQGPLVDFESWMPDFMNGLANGITANKYKVASALRGLTSDMSIGVKAQIQPYKSVAQKVTQVAGDTYNFYNQKSSAAENARQFRNTKRQILLGR